MTEAVLPRKDEKLDRIIELLVYEYGSERVYLFGSMDREAASEHNDYDILPVMPDAAAPEDLRARGATNGC